jgi:hypothetical protein
MFGLLAFADCSWFLHRTEWTLLVFVCKVRCSASLAVEMSLTLLSLQRDAVFLFWLKTRHDLSGYSWPLLGSESSQRSADVETSDATSSLKDDRSSLVGVLHKGGGRQL